MDTVHSTLPPPLPSLYWKAPDSHQHNVLCDNYRGEKSTKSPKNANNFKPNQPLIKQRGFFFSNTFELHMNLQLGEVDHMLTPEGVHYSQGHYEECAWVSEGLKILFFPAREGDAAPHDAPAQLTETTLPR